MIGVVFLLSIMIVIVFIAGYPIYFIYSRIICSYRTEKYGVPYTPKDKTVLDRFVWFISGIIVLWMIIHFGIGFGTFKGKSYEDYKNKAHSNLLYKTGMPDDARDFRFRCQYYGLGSTDAVSFTLQGESYDNFTHSVSEPDSGSVCSCDYDRLSSGVRYVIDDDIRDYTLLYYYSNADCKSIIRLIAANPDTGRIVIYEHFNN